MPNMRFLINNQAVPAAVIDAWELNRLDHEYRFLAKRGLTLATAPSAAHLDEDRVALAQLKAQQSPEFFRKLLKRRYQLGNFASKLAAWVSHGRRKFSVTEIVVAQSDLSTAQVMAAIEAIMLENTPAHQQMNLSTNPDHFVLESPGPKEQEVLEITGGSPLPNRFFATYGDESGLRSQLTPGYTQQAAGTARLADGTIIGGVRHQIKPEGDGFRFKALVEFPAILPNHIIHQHQYHLACEFRQWLTDVLG
ncbi:hypothetical protein [Lacticaseibacillus brantae]|uniref:hypothetical protein n=1 Tax=Lacticaseibacillus brantae TaxID=943673 RepID=UPI00070C9514|nr:hypothetical protein [Lacticaseibacillus brantae]